MGPTKSLTFSRVFQTCCLDNVRLLNPTFSKLFFPPSLGRKPFSQIFGIFGSLFHKNYHVSFSPKEGTTIRLLFQLDVPSGSFPWRLLEETTDVLYKLPEDGVLVQPNLTWRIIQGLVSGYIITMVSKSPK